MSRNKKYAFLLGYNGKKYRGCQYNKETETIERTLIQGLLASGLIKECNALPSKVSLQRCSRTDAGVHAALNVFVAKTSTEPSSTKVLAEFLSERSIHLYGVVRATKSFNAQRACESRIYEYLLPTFFLATSTYEEDWRRYSKCLGKGGVTNPNETLSFRLDTFSVLEDVREMFQKYVGTHNYHNFTTTKNKRGTLRYIKDVSVSEPFLEKSVEYIKITIHGQSFLYNQIRKMVGYVVECVRYSKGFSDKVFSGEKARVSTAPSEYLLLERPLYRHEKHEMAVDEDQLVETKKCLVYAEIFRPENLWSFFKWTAYTSGTTLGINLCEAMRGGEALIPDLLEAPRELSRACPNQEEDCVIDSEAGKENGC